MALPIARVGADVIIPFADLAPTTSHQFIGGSGDQGSTPGTGGATITGWKWILMDKPAGSSAAFNDDTLESPTLQNIDTRGTYRVMYRVQDNLGNWSEGDPLVPEIQGDAFIHVVVPTQYAELQIPAAGQRDVKLQLDLLWNEVDALRNAADSHTIGSHDSDGTGAQLDTLTQGGDATGLHSHDASDISGEAAVGVLGLIETVSAPLDPAHPKAINRAPVPVYTHVSGEISVKGGDESHGLCAFRLVETLWLRQFNVALLDGGGTSGSDWIFKLYLMSQSQFQTNDFAAATEVASQTILKAGTANEPLGTPDTSYELDVALTSGRWLVARCTAAPATPGSDASLSIMLERRV